MALRADNQGFLVGDPVDTRRAVDQLKLIRSDVAEIKRAVLGAVVKGGDGRKSRSSSGGSNPRVQSNTRDSGVATPSRARSGSQNSVALLLVNSNRTVAPVGRGRDASGKFSSGGQSSSGSTSIGNIDRKSQGLLSGFAEAPPIMQPLGSDSNRNMTVTMAPPDVGQDVRDRKIALLATGGFSGRG
jgi:hypothetical protein